jgi:hypothetical protein
VPVANEALHHGAHGRVEVTLHAFLTVTLDDDEWPAHAAVTSLPGKGSAVSNWICD